MWEIWKKHSREPCNLLLGRLTSSRASQGFSAGASVFHGACLWKGPGYLRALAFTETSINSTNPLHPSRLQIQIQWWWSRRWHRWPLSAAVPPSNPTSGSPVSAPRIQISCPHLRSLGWEFALIFSSSNIHVYQNCNTTCCFDCMLIQLIEMWIERNSWDALQDSCVAEIFGGRKNAVHHV